MHPVLQTPAALGMGMYMWEMTLPIRSALWKRRENKIRSPNNGL